MSVHNISVPWTNKELQISYQTWNDKTKPGSREQWKIKIAGYKKDEVAAEVLTSMYDASLDQFANNSWSIPDIYPVYNRGDTWDNSSNFSDVISHMRPDERRVPYIVLQNSYDELLNFNNQIAGGGGLQDDVILWEIKLPRWILLYKLLRCVHTKASKRDKMAPPKVEMVKFTPPENCKG